jgi:hydroxyacylglutathione hydrolase
MKDSEERLELRQREVGPWPVNSYALVCPATGQSVLIDPGADPDELLEMLAGSEPVAILVTHTHPDHVGALQEMRARLNVPVLAHPGAHFEGLDPDADHWLQDGETVRVGNQALRVYHTPGHIGDLVCFALWNEDGGGDRRAIVGDAIFEGGPGKTWSPEGFQTTLHTLREIILRWPDAVVCYPGHGPAFRLGDKRAEIEAFLATDHGEFYGDATWDM